MAKYEKKRKKPNFIFTIQPGEPTLDECIADMAKVVFQLYEMNKKKRFRKWLKNSKNQNLK